MGKHVTNRTKITTFILLFIMIFQNTFNILAMDTLGADASAMVSEAGEEDLRTEPVAEIVPQALEEAKTEFAPVIVRGASVEVEVPEEAGFPEDTELIVRTINTSDVEAVLDNELSIEDDQITQTEFFDISFVSASKGEVEPANGSSVKVTLKFNTPILNAKDGCYPVKRAFVHILDDGTIETPSYTMSKNDETGAVSEITFSSSTFSTFGGYGIDEEYKTVFAPVTADNVKVSVKVPVKAEFHQDTILKVAAVDPDQVNELLNETHPLPDGWARQSALYDIHFEDGNGATVEPKNGTVKVTMEFDSPVLCPTEEMTDLPKVIYHIKDNGEIECFTPASIEKDFITGGVNAVSFDLSSFGLVGPAGDAAAPKPPAETVDLSTIGKENIEIIYKEIIGDDYVDLYMIPDDGTTKVRFDLVFKIPNDMIKAGVTKYAEYQMPTEYIRFPTNANRGDIRDPNQEIVGTYTFDPMTGKFFITFRQSFLESNGNVTIDLTRDIEIRKDNIDNLEEVPFDFPGTDGIKVKIDHKGKEPSGVKKHTEVYQIGNEKYVDYEVRMTLHKNRENVVLYDELDSCLSFVPTSFKFDGTVVEAEKLQINGQSAVFSLGNLASGTYVITYSAKVDTVSDKEVENIAYWTWTGGKSRPVTDRLTFQEPAITINSPDFSDNTVDWIAELKKGTFTSAEEMKNAEYVNNYNTAFELLEDSLKVEDTVNESVLAKGVDYDLAVNASAHQFTINFHYAGAIEVPEYKVIYTTIVSDNLADGDTFENEGAFTPKDETPVHGEGTATYKEPVDSKDFPMQKKVLDVQYDVDGNAIAKWEVRVEIKEDVYWNWSISDEICPETVFLAYPEPEIDIKCQQGGYDHFDPVKMSGPFVDFFTPNTICIDVWANEEDPLLHAGDVVTVSYWSKTNALDITCEVKNEAVFTWWDYDWWDYWSSATDSFIYDKTTTSVKGHLKKYAIEPDPSSADALYGWEVNVNLDNNGTKPMGDLGTSMILVQDNLPEGMKQTGTCYYRLLDEYEPFNIAGAAAIIPTKDADGNLTFRMDKIENKILQIFYQTEIEEGYLTGKGLLSGKVIFTNCASYSDAKSGVIDTDFATATKNVSKVLDKTVIETDKPDASEADDKCLKFTVPINMGSLDLNPNHDFIDLVDELTGLYYYMPGTIETEPADALISYRIDNKKLYVRVKDEIPVTLTYLVDVIFENQGDTERENEYIKNRVSLECCPEIYAETEGQYTFRRENTDIPGEIYTATLIKTDYETGAPIEDATYEIRRMWYTNEDGGKFIEPSDAAYDPEVDGPFIATSGPDGKVKFEGLLFDVLYRLEETKAPDGYELDPKIHYFYMLGNESAPVQSELKNYPGAIQLSAQSGYIVPISDFANRINVVLEAEKELIGDELRDKQFIFELRTNDGELIGTAKNDAEGKVRFDTVMVDGVKYEEGLSFKNSGTYYFTINERKGIKNNFNYDTRVVKVKVTVSRNELTGALEPKVEYDDQDAIPRFTNTCNETKVAFQAITSLTGRSLYANEFSFVLKENDVEIQKMTNNASGNVYFDEITYTNEGIYQYTINEEKGNLEEVTYTTRVVNVRVVVEEDEDGQLSATVTYAGETTIPTFANLFSHNWSDEWTSDEAAHWHACLNNGCDEKKDYSIHTGGTASCQKKAVCEICENGYGDFGEHNWSDEWTSDKTGCWHACQTTGCTEKKDYVKREPIILSLSGTVLTGTVDVDSAIIQMGLIFSTSADATLDTPGRTCIVFTELSSDGTFIFDAAGLTGYTFRAYVIYTNEDREEVVAYSEPINF